MDKEIKRHRSTANTARLVSSIVLIASFLLLVAGVTMLAVSLTPTGATEAAELIPERFNAWININTIQAATLLGLSILFAWMGYALRLLVCLLESQLPNTSTTTKQTNR